MKYLKYVLTNITSLFLLTCYFLLCSSLSTVFHLQNVFTVPASKAVKIDFHSIKVPPDSKIATEVAVIIFDRKLLFFTLKSCIFFSHKS